nr:unnamed protein product [Digitaria exilis]
MRRAPLLSSLLALGSRRRLVGHWPLALGLAVAGEAGCAAAGNRGGDDAEAEHSSGPEHAEAEAGGRGVAPSAGADSAAKVARQAWASAVGPLDPPGGIALMPMEDDSPGLAARAMAPRRRRRRPELMAELVEEIFLRIPPDDPAALVRASFVCKSWRRLLSDPALGRRYRAFHRAPPLLGFLHQHHDPDVGIIPRFVPTATPSPLPEPAFGGCVLDCRHGRVLFHLPVEGVNLVVWDPVTGEGEELPEPRIFLRANNAAVLCAVRGCDHLDCQGGPFVVVVVGYGKGNKGMQSHLYSSEKDAWIASAELAHGTDSL